MKTKILLVSATLLFVACGQTPPAATTTTKPAASTGQPLHPGGASNGVHALSFTSGSMQIVAHDGDKEGTSYTNYIWNYSSASAQSSFAKGVQWLETDVILNRSSGILYMGHDEECIADDGKTLNLWTDYSVDIDASHCAERFTTQLDTLGNEGKWMIELKGDKTFGSEMTPEYREAVVNSVYETLNERGRLSSEIVTSMDREALLMFKARADREGKTVYLAHVYPLSLNPFTTNRPTETRLNQDVADGFQFASAAVKDWSNDLIDYARGIGLQTMGWGWDDGYIQERDPVGDNGRGIDLCVDYMLTEAITDLVNRDKTCKRRNPPTGDISIPATGDSDFDKLGISPTGISAIDNANPQVICGGYGVSSESADSMNLGRCGNNADGSPGGDGAYSSRSQMKFVTVVQVIKKTYAYHPQDNELCKYRFTKPLFYGNSVKVVPVNDAIYKNGLYRDEMPNGDYYNASYSKLGINYLLMFSITGQDVWSTYGIAPLKWNRYWRGSNYTGAQFGDDKEIASYKIVITDESAGADPFAAFSGCTRL